MIENRKKTQEIAPEGLPQAPCTWAYALCSLERPGQAFHYCPRRLAPPGMCHSPNSKSKPAFCSFSSWIGRKSLVFTT